MKPNYNLYCVARRCNETFATVKDWNSHYRLWHGKIPLKCDKCPKISKMPSSWRDHKASHKDKQYVCTVCDQKFVYKSGVQIHRQVHLKQKLYKCFVGLCKATYKFRQDLHRHIQRHLEGVHRCRLCKYSSSEKWMVHHHQVVHKPE